MSIIVNSGEFYQDYKNRLYQVITTAENSENGEMLVVYQALYDEYKVYVGSVDRFVDERNYNKCSLEQQKYCLKKVKVTKERTGEKTDVIQEEVLKDEMLEPGLLEFLDEDNWDKKYNILVSLCDKMTDKLVDDLAVAMDVVIPDGPIDKRYEELKICVRTRQKYESQHLR